MALQPLPQAASVHNFDWAISNLSSLLSNTGMLDCNFRYAIDQ